MNNFIKTLFFVLLIVTLSACAQQPVAGYKPAVLQKSSDVPVKTRYVPVPIPGQLMPKPQNEIKGPRQLTGVSAVSAANKKAQRNPRSSQYVNAIMNFDYMDGALYQIYCAPLCVTDIQFQASERIVSIAAGDTLRWQVSKTYSGDDADRSEHLLVKPIEEDLTNTLVVTTDRRTYHLLLRSTRSTYMASVQWRYPDSDDFVRTFDRAPGKQGSVLPASLGRNVDINQLDFNYNIQLVSGDQPDWMPKMVFTDGQKTYVQFPKNMQEAPTLFIGTSAGNDRVVNYRVDGDYYIVDGVITQAQLRLGQMQQTVVQIIKN
ncbi:MAG: P-type conjugative transfer protein TrbG [Gammaproteobacteria bacterium]|nr:P-type conjugative transfer protein TrbG [Gammaproteobacteria bacterium]